MFLFPQAACQTPDIRYGLGVFGPVTCMIYFEDIFNRERYKDNKIILENNRKQTLELKLVVNLSTDIDNKL